MKKLLIGSVLFLAGCSNYVGAHEWAKAEQLCADSGGVRGVNAAPFAAVECNNLTRYAIHG